MPHLDEETELFSVLGKLNVTIGSVDESLKAQKQAWQRASMQETPRFIRISGSVALNGTGFGVVQFDNRPDQGHFWYVRKLVVGGLTPTTTTAGRADVFVTAQDLRRITALAEIGLVDWRDQAATLPLVGVYSRGELTVPSPYDLFVIVSGGTANQQIVVAGDIEDYQEGSGPGRLGF